MKKLLFILLAFAMFGVGRAQQRYVLVEMFTNSDCPLCPPAHAALNGFVAKDTNAKHVNFIYYHMKFPYPQDPLYQANTADPAARNSYYGPYSATPDAFFDGKAQSNSYSAWAGRIDNEVMVVSPFNISLSGMRSDTTFTVEAQVSALDSVAADDLVLHFVVVENVTYRGNNGVSPQFYVMRKMLPDADGMPMSVSVGSTKKFSQEIDLQPTWIPDSLSVVVFIQSKSSTTVYQSARIPYSSTVTSINKNKGVYPAYYKLEQNYPNPFNPSTNINYTLASSQFVTLKVYDILGNEIVSLVNEQKPAGNYTVKFNALNLGSGIYFYQLKAGNFIRTKKMILLK
jgi:thiol-disulfide isomerase/thioredoxin